MVLFFLGVGGGRIEFQLALVRNILWQEAVDQFAGESGHVVELVSPDWR